jgi:hypothetical protein
MFPAISQPHGHGPRSRMCYICGRQTLLAGFDHHVLGCRDLFIKREELKPKKERRKPPEDPMVKINQDGRGGNVTLEEINDLSNQAYAANLSQCLNCGRKFLPEKLIIHNRSCTADNPAKSVKKVELDQGNQNIDMGRPNTRGNMVPNVPSTPSSNNVRQQIPSQLPPEDFVPAMLIKCPDCDRSFNETAFSHHVKVCKKVFGEKRKVFDSKKHRIDGTEISDFTNSNVNTKPKGKDISALQSNSKTMTNSKMEAGGEDTPKWKADSNAFRNAMKLARKVAQAEKKSAETGIPLSKLLPPPTSQANDPVYAGYVQCKLYTITTHHTAPCET